MRDGSVYNRNLGRAVARKARPARRYKLHVISSGEGIWAVVIEGTVRPVKNFQNVRQAVSFAKRYARQIASNEVVVHDKEGAIKANYHL